MELSDRVKATLTEEGAKWLTMECIRKVTAFGVIATAPFFGFYKEGETLSLLLRELFQMFNGYPFSTERAPFINLRSDDQRCHCRASLRVSQIS